MRRVWVLPVLTAALVGQQPNTSATGQIPSAEIIGALEQATNWYRNVSNLTQANGASVDLLLRENTQQNALKSLQLAFDFSRAEAAYKAALRANPEDAASPGSQDMAQVAVRAAARVTGVETQIADIENAISKAPAAKRATLEAQRDELTAQLALVKEIQKSVQAIASFVGTNNSGSGAAGKLAGQINDLERTVPEARQAQAQGATPPAATPRTESSGIAGLTSQVFTLGKVRGDLRDLIDDTDALLKKLDALRTPTLAAVKDSVQQADDLAAAAKGDTVDQLTAGKKEVLALTARFKLLSTVLVPLREEQLLVESTRGNLVEWRNVVNRQYTQVLRTLLLRVGMLLAGIAVVLLVSAVWQRATMRYIREPRRKRQFQLLRRVVVFSVIGLLLVLSFVTEFGSVATYAGFLTAGLAVALQNVILAVVAYFFLIGRYGVRVGDRVTISGVSGEVIEMDLVRMYLMERTGSGEDNHATGRVVVFSNSVLFQPQAIYKQLPGTNYLWHTCTVVLTPESNPEVAEASLTKAVESVYEQYRGSIEQQHAEFERSVDVEMTVPRPECRLRATDAGLEFRARYPVELKGAADTDNRVLKALNDAVAVEKELALASDGAPKLVAE
jgi:small-conductance mechanosensitive channel/tetratricopeptide (TPR) repeat protein